MTVQPLAVVIPSSAVPAARQRARSAAGRRLPLARPVPVPSLPQDVIYRTGRIDSSGRVADQGVLAEVCRVVEEELSAHQRRIFVAVVVD